MSVTFPVLKDYFTLSGKSENLTNEEHPIPASSPYAIDLNQIPQVVGAVTTLLENVWVDVATAAGLITIELSDNNGSSWQACTIVGSNPPSALQVYLQLSETDDFPFSPRCIFNSGQAGWLMRATYTGLGSAPLAAYFTQLQNHIERFDAFAPLRMIDTATYHLGWYDGLGAESTSVYVNPSGFYLAFPDGDYAWAGGLAEFDTGGNCEVAAFTDTDGWKRIGVYLIDSGVALGFVTMESAESVTQGGLSNPTAYTAAQSVFLGYVDVQGDGVGGAGAIENLNPSYIDSHLVLGVGGSGGTSATSLVAQTYGALVGGYLDNAIYLPRAGEITGCFLSCEDMGVDTTDLRIDIELDGVSLFAADGDKPQIAQATGTFQSDSTPTTDFTDVVFAADQWLTFPIDTYPDDAENVRLLLEVRYY